MEWRFDIFRSQGLRISRLYAALITEIDCDQNLYQEIEWTLTKMKVHKMHYPIQIWLIIRRNVRPSDIWLSGITLTDDIQSKINLKLKPIQHIL